MGGNLNWTAKDLENINRKTDIDASTLPPVRGHKKHADIQNEIYLKQVKQNTNSLTKGCIDLLNTNGYKVWRNNNNAVYDVKKKCFRTPSEGSINGVPDIIGYKKGDDKNLTSSSAKFIGIEIKTGKDKLSQEQVIFADDCIQHNATYLVVHNVQQLATYLGIKI